MSKKTKKTINKVHGNLPGFFIFQIRVYSLGCSFLGGAE